MAYDIDTVKKILKNLKEDPMRITYTEHYLEQIEKRDIPEIFITDLLENEMPSEINKIPQKTSTFELIYPIGDSDEMQILVSLFNLKGVILISAIIKNHTEKPNINNVLEFEGIYDQAFNLMDFHSKSGFRFCQTVEMEPGFNIDFDACGHPVAIEMIQASKKMKLHHKFFSSAEFEGQISITPDSIKIRLKASVNVKSIDTRIYENEIANTYGIAENQFDLNFEMIND